jgi:hypothetical protein
LNAVEIEEAVSKLAEQSFDAENFPFLFLEAFGNKPTTIQRLRSGTSNKSDVDGGILQHNNIHIAVSKVEDVTNTLTKLRESSATKKQKVKFILATDGKEFQAEDLSSDIAPIICEYKDFSDHFGFFLELAGISTVKQIRESSFDIKATGRLNRLYVELLKDNPKWGSPERRHDMNHFMARLIFCFFAEDTSIFNQESLFSKTIGLMSEKDSSNTHEVMEQIFLAMNTNYNERKKAKIPRWVEDFPYVNGGLFSGKTEVPRFSKIARSYLLHIGNLEWKKINPDIFGSMIQAVTEDEERGALGMHYTSVPNILRVLNPLFLDDLREQLDKAGNNARMLLNLRKRISKIRVFDPACGSGNFLVIAYKEMRAIEAEVNRRRGESNAQTEIQLTNFRGIELRDFPAEVARLALIIAEYQCNVLYIGQMLALQEFLPLEAENWILCGNALHLEWSKVCPPIELIKGSDGIQPETYICGNPPYVGRKYQSSEQKTDLKQVFKGRTKDTLSLDYVAGWFIKAVDYMVHIRAEAAFVSTNSICQGVQVSALWPTIFSMGASISFTYPSFKWSNLASNNAGVTVSIVGLTIEKTATRKIFTIEEGGETTVKETAHINAYLVAGSNVLVSARSKVRDERTPMQFGNHPYYANSLMLEPSEARMLVKKNPELAKFIRPLYGSREFINRTPRSCIWITEKTLKEALSFKEISERVEEVRKHRLGKKTDSQAVKLVGTPYRFRDQYQASSSVLIVPIVSSENRPYLPVGVENSDSIVHNKAFALYDAPLWNMAIIASRLHWIWIGTVCVRLEMRFSYSNTLGWNTFPIPHLTQKNKDDLARCAEDILLAREAHFPATIADLYDPETMPNDLRLAHERNDEVLERIYIGRRFKNDSERLEKLFELYTKVTSSAEVAPNEKSKRKTKEAKK